MMQGIPRPCAVCRVPCCHEPVCEAMIMAPWLVPEVSVAEMLELNTFGPGGWHLGSMLARQGLVPGWIWLATPT